MSELERPQSGRFLSLASMVTFVGFLDTHLLIPVMALYASELGSPPWMVGVIVGLYSLTNTPANILFGRLIDRVGHKVPLVAGLIGDALSMFLYSVCRAPLHLSLVRMLHGITGGMVGPATMSVIAGYGGGEGRGRTMAVYGMSLAAATLVGYGVSGVLASRMGYQSVFFFGTALLIVGAVLSLWLPGGRRESRENKTSSGQGFEKAKGLLRRRGLVVAYCSVFAQYFTFGGVVTLLPLYIKSLGMEAFHVGMLLATFAIMFIIVQFPSGRFSDKVGRRRPIIVGLSLSVVALVVMPSMATFALPAAHWWADRHQQCHHGG